LFPKSARRQILLVVVLFFFLETFLESPSDPAPSSGDPELDPALIQEA